MVLDSLADRDTGVDVGIACRPSTMTAATATTSSTTNNPAASHRPARDTNGRQERRIASHAYSHLSTAYTATMATWKTVLGTTMSSLWPVARYQLVAARSFFAALPAYARLKAPTRTRTPLTNHPTQAGRDESWEGHSQEGHKRATTATATAQQMVRPSVRKRWSKGSGTPRMVKGWPSPEILRTWATLGSTLRTRNTTSRPVAASGAASS
mmetsp:Transcript_5750/g.16270  ORF Transcript_5750/g.16270 Transcript_5750/m.16270 type:complete len:211 (-) Transcript_5750:159-791(-)